MLPTTKTPVRTSASAMTALLYGRPKLGKSTFCSQAKNAIFLATEPGLNHLEVFQTEVKTWEQMLAACGELAAGKHEFKTVVVDTIDNLYRFCSEHVCRREGVQHEADLPFGKGYALIQNEFQRVLTKLAFLPMGLILVAHAVEKEFETRTGKVTRVVPDLPERARRIVLALVDLVLFVDIDVATGADGKPVARRVIRTKPSPTYDAGDRTGRLPEVLDLNFAALDEALRRPSPNHGPATAVTAPTQNPNLSKTNPQ